MDWWKKWLPLSVLFLLLFGLLRAGVDFFYDGMVHVEKHEFQMGCDECQLRERPRHAVKLSSFWIDHYEITTAQYVEFLNDALEQGWAEVIIEDGIQKKVKINGKTVIKLSPSVSWTHITYQDGGFVVVDGKQKHPVTVSWYGAHAYCDANGKRLPSEAEWESAAKGGHLARVFTGATDYFRYSGSDDPDTVAWHRNNSESSSHPVGELNPNELQTFDMSGNLREWVNDWYDQYPTERQEDPQGPDQPVHIPELQPGPYYAGKVMRGGSWREDTYPNDVDIELEMDIDPEGVRVTKRDLGCPGNSSSRTGFRCAAQTLSLSIARYAPVFPLSRPRSFTADRLPADEAFYQPD